MIRIPFSFVVGRNLLDRRIEWLVDRGRRVARHGKRRVASRRNLHRRDWPSNDSVGSATGSRRDSIPVTAAAAAQA